MPAFAPTGAADRVSLGMTLHVTDALVLHAFDYLETSRIFRLATRESGVVSVIARGARMSVKRFGSNVDLFVSGTAEIQQRPGRDLQTLTGFELSRSRSALALDLDRFASASMLSEIALKCTAGETHAETFDTLTQALDGLLLVSGNGARVAGVRAAWELVGSLGFAPALEVCASCHRSLDPEDELLFSHRLGGAVCVSCEGAARGGRRLPGAARLTIAGWLSGDEHARPDASMLRAHARLLREFVQHHVSEGGELRAFAAWSARLDSA